MSTKQVYLGQLGIVELKEKVLGSIQQRVSKELGRLMFAPSQKLFSEPLVIPVMSSDDKNKTYHYYRNIRCSIFPLFEAFQTEDIETHLIEVLKDQAVSQREESLLIQVVDDTILFYELVKLNQEYQPKKETEEESVARCLEVLGFS
jgi:hypothetical protein